MPLTRVAQLLAFLKEWAETTDERALCFQESARVSLLHFGGQGKIFMSLPALRRN